MYVSWVTPRTAQSHIQEGTGHEDYPLDRIDDHADNWTIAHVRGSEEKPTKEFELIPNEAGYRKLLAFAKTLGGAVRFVYEAGPCGYDLYRRSTRPGSAVTWPPLR